MEIIWNGFLFGLLLCILIGPVFFALLQNAIEKGFWAGFFMAIGIAISDAMYILLINFGVSSFLNNEIFQKWMGGIGGLIMVVFGLYYLLKPVPKRKVIHLKSGQTKGVQQVIKGFLLNAINPFVFLFWLGIVSKVNLSLGYQDNELVLFFTVLIATVFICDILKSHYAGKLRDMVTDRFMKIMNRVVGIALILFSIRLFSFVVSGVQV